MKRKHQRAERKRARSAGDGGEAELAAAKKRRRKGKRRITEVGCRCCDKTLRPTLLRCRLVVTVCLLHGLIVCANNQMSVFRCWGGAVVPLRTRPDGLDFVMRQGRRECFEVSRNAWRFLDTVTEYVSKHFVMMEAFRWCSWISPKMCNSDKCTYYVTTIQCCLCTAMSECPDCNAVADLDQRASHHIILG